MIGSLSLKSWQSLAGTFYYLTIEVSASLPNTKAVLPPGPFVAIGCSAGAFVVQHMAIHAPEHIAAVVFIAAQGSRATAVAGDAKFFKLGRATYHEGSHEGERDSQGFYRQTEKDIDNRMKLFYYFIDSKSKDLVNRAFREICKRSLSEVRPKAVIAAQLKMLGTADYGGQLSSIRCPALCIHGEHDEVIPSANGEQLYNDLSSSSPVSVASGKCQGATLCSVLELLLDGVQQEKF